MSYNANIPQAGDQISQSQLQILDNFLALQGAATNTFPYLLLGPPAVAPATSATQVALYTNTYSAAMGATLPTQELFYEKISSGTTYTITASTASTVNPVTTNLNGWTYLPSGLLVKWGTTIASVTAPTSSGFVAYPTDPNNNIPAFTTAVMFVSVSGAYLAGSSSGIVYNGTFVAAPTLLGFTVFALNPLTGTGFTGPVGVGINYLAIGI